MKKPPKKSEPPFEIRSFFIQFSIFRSALPLRSSKNFQFSARLCRFARRRILNFQLINRSRQCRRHSW